MYTVRIYNKSTEGTVHLSANFTVREFACNDGSDVVIVNPKLVGILQKIRNHFGVPVTINSAYRTVSYNKTVGGSSSESQHCLGNAADIVVKGKTPRQVAQYVDTLLPGTGGIGVYGTFTHVDVRTTKARW